MKNEKWRKGKDKAILFRNRLGITLENKAILEVALLESAVNKEAEIYKTDNYGTQYDIKFFMTTETGISWVLSCWMIRTDEDFPRLTNTYPVNK